MNVDKLKVTKHAIERFVGWADDSIPSNPEEAIRKLFAEAFQVKFNNFHSVLRLLRHNFDETMYFYARGWVFVCMGKDPVSIVTVERPSGKLGKDIIKV